MVDVADVVDVEAKKKLFGISMRIIGSSYLWLWLLFRMEFEMAKILDH